MKKRILIVIPIILIIGVVVLIILWAQAPSRGRVSPVSAANKPVHAPSIKELNGNYLSFQYGGEYTARAEAPRDSALERHALAASTHYHKQILVSVVTLPDGQLRSNGDYVYRQKSTNLYTNRKFQTKGEVVDVWVKRDGTEQTVMVPRGDKAAVVSLVTGPGANVDLTTEMNALLMTLEWEK